MKKALKLHPAIVHINCSTNMSPDSIRLINEMVERASKMKFPPKKHKP